jgi:16S rRNA G527 N7-methylase RsmG
MVAAFRETLLANACAAGRSLSKPELESLEAHFHLLVKWGRRMNLTGLKDESTIVRRHFLEPIATA